MGLILNYFKAYLLVKNHMESIKNMTSYVIFQVHCPKIFLRNSYFMITTLSKQILYMEKNLILQWILHQIFVIISDHSIIEKFRMDFILMVELQLIKSNYYFIIFTYICSERNELRFSIQRCIILLFQYFLKKFYVF